jgi:cobalt-zinc-cadmium efflux system outer membrane protein
VNDRVKSAVLVIVCAALLGCASFHDEALSPPRTVSDFEARSLASSELRNYIESNLRRKITPWPAGSWDFTMLTLAAFYYHPDLDVARARWQVKEAGIITAGGRPNPAVGFTPQYHVNPGGLSPWTLFFSSDFPVETAGKRGYRIAEASHVSAAARLGIAGTAWQVRSRLRKSLVELYGAQRNEEILGRQVALHQETADVAGKRATLGEESRLALMQSEIALNQTRLRLAEVRQERAVARARVASSLGLTEKALDGVTIFFSFLDGNPPEIPSAEVRGEALTSRPDILARLEEYEASQSALQLEIARQYPDIHLGPGYSWDQGDNEWSLGFSVALPIFNRNEGPMAEARARRKEAAAQFRALQAKIIGEVEAAYADYAAALKKLKDADSLVRSRQKRCKAAEAMFAAGEEDRLSVLAAELELSSAEQLRLENLVSVQQSLGSLEDAVQRPLGEAEPAAVNMEKDPRTKGENHR